jgi:hypothetical protein
MQELEYIKSERLRLQEKYLKEAREVWMQFEGEEADRKHKKLHSEYRNKDYFLEGIQSKIEAVLSDIEYYKSK